MICNLDKSIHKKDINLEKNLINIQDINTSTPNSDNKIYFLKWHDYSCRYDSFFFGSIFRY